MKKICSNCNEYCNPIIKEEIEEISIKNETIKVDTQHQYCPNCNTFIYDAAVNKSNIKKADEIYRKKYSILSAQEILDIRKKYSISQDTFSKIIGISKNAIESYERGKIPNKSHSNLILLCKNPENFFNLVEQNKFEINNEKYIRLMQYKKYNI